MSKKKNGIEIEVLDTVTWDEPLEVSNGSLDINKYKHYYVLSEKQFSEITSVNKMQLLVYFLFGISVGILMLGWFLG